MFSRIKGKLKKWNLIPNENNWNTNSSKKSRLLERENKAKQSATLEKTIENNRQKTSLLKTEEIQRVSLLDLKKLEKNPPVWKSIKIDYRQGLLVL